MSEESATVEAAAEPVVEQAQEDTSTQVSSPDVYKLKVDGEEIEVDIEELKKGYNISKVSDKRLKEAAELRKQTDEFIDTLISGDLNYLKSIVPEDKLLEWAEASIREKVEWDDMPEEKKQLLQAKREAEQLREKLGEYSKKEQKQIIDQANYEAEQEIDNGIADAIEDLQKVNKNVKITPVLIQNIALDMLAQLQKGAAKPSAKEATQRSYQKFSKHFKSYLDNLDGDDLVKMLSAKQREKLRKMDLDTALSQLPGSRRSKSKELPKKKEKVKMSTDDYFNMMAERLEG